MTYISFLEYKFKNVALLENALTHPSMVLKQNNKSVLSSYERMEFLGDSVLSCIMAEKIYKLFPDYCEGQLSLMLANVINSKSLVKVAKEIQISEYIKMTIGEELSGGRLNDNILENVVEALIGAIFLDSNYKTVSHVIFRWWEIIFENKSLLIQKDYKTSLQEIVQKRYNILPLYSVTSRQGASHKPLFTVSASVKKMLTYGICSTKKNAEQKAANLMIKKINEHNE